MIIPETIANSGRAELSAQILLLTRHSNKHSKHEGLDQAETSMPSELLCFPRSFSPLLTPLPPLLPSFSKCSSPTLKLLYCSLFFPHLPSHYPRFFFSECTEVLGTVPLTSQPPKGYLLGHSTWRIMSLLSYGPVPSSWLSYLGMCR